MADTPQFQVAITAQDQTARVLADISRGVGALVKQIQGNMPVAVTVATATGPWDRMGAHIAMVQGGIARLNSGLGGAFSRVSALIPPLAGLGAVGSIGGLFALTESVSKASAEMGALSEKTQMSRAQIGLLSFQAKVSEVSVETLASSSEKLNKAIGGAMSGKDKNAATMFKALGISLRDAGGHARETFDVMQDVFKAIRVNEEAGQRSSILTALMGKGGAEMLPMLVQSKDVLTQWAADYKRLKFSPSEEQVKGLEKYHYSWQKLELAVSAVSKEVGTRLAPVLTPVVTMFTEWLSEHRTEIATRFSETIRTVGQWMQNTDWHRISRDFGDMATNAKWVFDELGGVKGVLITIGVVEGLGMLGKVSSGLRAMGDAAMAARAGMIAIGNGPAYASLVAFAGTTAGLSLALGGVLAAAVGLAKLGSDAEKDPKTGQEIERQNKQWRSAGSGWGSFPLDGRDIEGRPIPRSMDMPISGPGDAGRRDRGSQPFWNPGRDPGAERGSDIPRSKVEVEVIIRGAPPGSTAAGSGSGIFGLPKINLGDAFNGWGLSAGVLP